mgnify:CR=1 FL=1|jgi:hypothetical protein
MYRGQVPGTAILQSRYSVAPDEPAEDFNKQTKQQFIIKGSRVYNTKPTPLSHRGDIGPH